MSTLKSLSIVANLSEAVQLKGEKCVVSVTTSASSTITVLRSIDGAAFSTIPDLSLVVNGTDEMNLEGFLPGQFIKVNSTATMTACKILQ